MNSHNVTKRATATATATATGESTSPTSKKRVKRVKRVRKPKGDKKLKKALSLLTSALTGAVLVCVTYLVATRIAHRSDHDHDHEHEHDHELHERNEHDHSHRHNHDLKHHNRKNKFNDLNAENEPLTARGDDEAGSWFGVGGGAEGGSSAKYKHSDFMQTVGDHSANYRQLRKEYDARLPHDTYDDKQSNANLERMRKVVQSLKPNTYQNLMKHDLPYDIHNCPEYPPPNYPMAWNVQDVLENWPPDDTFTPRSHIYQGLCYFDHATEYHKALNYREAEVPFVIHNDPAVIRTVERWNQPNYLRKLLGPRTRYRTEFSHNNHFMYWSKPGKRQRKNGDVPPDWKPPTEMQRTTFDQWLGHANVTDEELLQPDRDHWYFRLIGCGEMGDCDRDSSEYLFDELPFFQPREENELYMVEPKKQKGIHCRFGMKGVIAENHFDGSRNMIVVLGGERRYILSHPDQCENLVLLPRGHPSARHSAVDWSDPDWEEFPDFQNAEVNEVVLQAGDVLYLPTNWFHYIISLGLNFQCNTRSGVNRDYMDAIHDCGF